MHPWGRNLLRELSKHPFSHVSDFFRQEKILQVVILVKSTAWTFKTYDKKNPIEFG
jgi:hypothetical protein